MKKSVSAWLRCVSSNVFHTDFYFVVHRLTASLAFLIRLSPFYDTQLSPLLSVLQARAVLKSKFTKGGCGENGVTKKDLRKLLEDVAGKLCP